MSYLAVWSQHQLCWNTLYFLNSYALLCQKKPRKFLEIPKKILTKNLCFPFPRWDQQWKWCLPTGVQWLDSGQREKGDLSKRWTILRTVRCESLPNIKEIFGARGLSCASTDTNIQIDRNTNTNVKGGQIWCSWDSWPGMEEKKEMSRNWVGRLVDGFFYNSSNCLF